MSRCLLDVDFLFSEKAYIFAKQVLICGITKNGKTLIKKIAYNYPSIARESNDDYTESEARNLFKAGFKNGNIEFPRTDIELTNILSKFDVVIVKNRAEKEFITHYTANDLIIVETQNKRR